MSALQLTHTPALQTLPTSQDFPFGALPESAHRGAPLPQSILPVAQGFVESQAIPAIHERQAPSGPQTRLTPQPSPTGRRPFVSMHLDVPPEQSSIPWWQGLAGTQASPAAHAAQLPSLHTIPAPQEIPAAALPISKHAAVPVVQSMAPTRHGFPDRSHDVPAVHLLHVPSRQTESTPHEVPLAWRLSPGRQLMFPPLQTVVPTRQGMDGTTHGVPATHPLDPMVVVPEVPPRGASMADLPSVLASTSGSARFNCEHDPRAGNAKKR
jgi:hypothetical protein